MSWRTKIQQYQLTILKLNWYLVSGIVFLAIIIALFMMSGWKLHTILNSAEALPIESIVVTGDRKFTSDEEIQSSMKELMKSSFFNVDVNRVQQALESLPWVYQASVRREWPAKFKVYLTEQQPIAHWNTNEWLNIYGDVFFAKTTPNESKVLAKLPYLYGPNALAKEVLAKHHQINELLLINQFHLKSLIFNSRHAWRLELSDGIILDLGREDTMARIQRFINLYPRLLEQQHKQVASVDLRYDTGLAVAWTNKDQRAVN